MEGSVVSTVNFRNFIAANRIQAQQIQELVSRCLDSKDKFAQTEIVVDGKKRLMKAVREIQGGEIILTLDRDYN